MRVALACPYDWGGQGGVRVHVAALAAELRARGHDVLILAPGTGPAERGLRLIGRPVGIPYNGSTAPIAPWPWVRRRVRRELERFAPDVVHVHEPLTPSVSMFAALESSAPVVATFHSAADRSVLFDVAAPALRRVARRVDVRIAVSRAAEAFVAPRIGGPFEIVPNGVDVESFANARPADLPPCTMMLFVGRLHPRKGFPDAVRAFAILAPRFADLRLAVIGSGRERNAVDELAPDLRRRVLLLGTLGTERWARYAAVADVFVAPNRGGESFGMILTEAMAAGLPVVASDIAGFDEVVADGVDGILVPPADPPALAAAVGRVLEDPDLAAGLAAAGRKKAESFSWPNVTDRIASLYEAARRRRGGALLR
ncbi:MAG: glycosyltransferase family 4 protein [Actinomycetota bacterium]